MIPVFLTLIYVYTHEREWVRQVALWIYVVAALSDILDGYIARRYDQKSEFGARLDPLADKLMINLGFIFIAANVAFDDPVPGWYPDAHVVPMWFPVFVLARDIIIVMGAYAIDKHFGPLELKPRVTGRLTTISQITALIGVLLGVWFAGYLIAACFIISLVGLIDYMYEGCMQAFVRNAA